MAAAAVNSETLKLTQKTAEGDDLCFDVERMGENIVAKVEGVSIKQFELLGKTYVRQGHGFYKATDQSFYFFETRPVQEIVVDLAPSGAHDPKVTLTYVPTDVEATALRAVEQLKDDAKLLDDAEIDAGGPTRGDVASRAATLETYVKDPKIIVDMVRLIHQNGTCYTYFKMGYHDLLRGTWTYLNDCSNNGGYKKTYTMGAHFYENGVKRVISRDELDSFNSQRTT